MFMILNRVNTSRGQQTLDSDGRINLLFVCMRLKTSIERENLIAYSSDPANLHDCL